MPLPLGQNKGVLQPLELLPAPQDQLFARVECVYGFIFVVQDAIPDPAVGLGLGLEPGLGLGLG